MREKYPYHPSLICKSVGGVFMVPMIGLDGITYEKTDTMSRDEYVPNRVLKEIIEKWESVCESRFEPPDCLCDPISLRQFVDPITYFEVGTTYSYEEISEYLAQQAREKKTAYDPLTAKEMSKTPRFVSNSNLEELLGWWCEQSKKHLDEAQKGVSRLGRFLKLIEGERLYSSCAENTIGFFSYSKRGLALSFVNGIKAIWSLPVNESAQPLREELIQLLNMSCDISTEEFVQKVDISEGLESAFMSKEDVIRLFQIRWKRSLSTTHENIARLWCESAAVPRAHCQQRI